MVGLDGAHFAETQKLEAPIKIVPATLALGGEAIQQSSMAARTTQSEMTDVLVWELVSVRCALAQPLEDNVCASLRRQERAVVGALLDMGVLAEDSVAPLPPVTGAAQALF